MSSKRFLSGSVVITSLRDNGYKNTAYALAELIDNSLQAGATIVDLGFIEKKSEKSKKHNIETITIMDNGKGMSPETLQLAMQFGGGLNKQDPDGMGKFGMGLPNSSISQCKRVDVWSWANPEEIYHTYLDIDEMVDGRLEEVPIPSKANFPINLVSNDHSGIPNSGTFISWSKLDRLNWKTGNSVFKHCEILVGRMYRRQLSENRVSIKSKTLRNVTASELCVDCEKMFKANDPLYLMKNTSLPELPNEYKNETFFELKEEASVEIEFVKSDGSVVNEQVIVRSSIVKNAIAKEALNVARKQSLGNTDWGKHCAHNIGVSIVRAGRELTIKDSFIPKKDKQYQARFYGVEVSFPPALDELLGVTNNKQDAVKLENIKLSELYADAGFDSEQAYRRDLEDNDDNLIKLFKIIEKINEQIKNRTVDLDKIVLKKSDNHTDIDSNSSVKASEGARTREENGKHVENFNEEKNLEDIKDHLKDALENITEEEADQIAEEIIERDYKYLIEYVKNDSDSFFDVSTKNGLTLVLINKNHPIYTDFLKSLDTQQRESMDLVLASFARVMNETNDEKKKKFLNIIRREWGIALRDFIEPDDLGDF